AFPPAVAITSTISSESVATHTWPMSASTARRQQCTISGTPTISARGFPGRRDDASRAGMMTSISGPGQQHHVAAGILDHIDDREMRLDLPTPPFDIPHRHVERLAQQFRPHL